MDVTNEEGLGGDGPAQSKAPLSAPTRGNNRRRCLSGILSCLVILEEKVDDFVQTPLVAQIAIISSLAFLQNTLKVRGHEPVQVGR